MKLTLTLAAIFLFLVISQSFSQKENTTPVLSSRFGVNFWMSSAGHYYDNEGNVIIESDVPGFGKDTSALLKYDYHETTVEPYYQRFFFERLKLRASVPITYHKLESTLYVTSKSPTGTINPWTGKPDTLNKTDRYPLDKLTSTRVDYVSLGAEYYINKQQEKFYNFSAGLTAHIPTGFEDGAPDDSSRRFLDDYFLELIPFLSGSANFSNYRTYLRGSYRYRAENMTDQLDLFGRFGYESIPGAMLYVQVNFLKSLEEIETKEFNIYRRPNGDDYLSLGFGLEFKYNNIYANVSYNLPMWGRNIWKTSVFDIILGVSL